MKSTDNKRFWARQSIAVKSIIILSGVLISYAVATVVYHQLKPKK
jgi:hypothetical protein